ncbi:N-acetyltransferase [Fulvitalea axinellae]|uniref:N-acetyltransferase n=1 Tax=Fulvitalea axinellae TaxID=1182444 RepID=A0AAU9CDY6_9BACT|nr:N-acetyltransferase [Fulvitalea axinellae]
MEEIKTNKVTVRKGTEKDLPKVLELICELATHVNHLDQVEVTVEDMAKDGFGPNPVFGFFIAENQNGIIGLALYYYRYSTWKGKVVYLEDLVVKEAYRAQGIGTKLLKSVINLAKEQGLRHVSWQVIDTNVSAIGYYREKFGAQLHNNWINCLLPAGDFERVLSEK